MNYGLRMTEDGRAALPEELVREFHLQPGDSLVVVREDDHFVIKFYFQVVKEVQAKFRAMLPVGYTGSLADELIAGRRAEARRDDAELDAWLRDREAR